MARDHIVLIVLSVALIAASLRAQTSDQKPLMFEVASVKLNPGVDSQQTARLLPGGRFAVTNMPLRTLMRYAYGIEVSQIVGGPSWVGTDGYDLVAKAPMLKTLLETRFQLRTHSEMRDTQTEFVIIDHVEKPTPD